MHGRRELCTLSSAQPLVITTCIHDHAVASVVYNTSNSAVADRPREAAQTAER